MRRALATPGRNRSAIGQSASFTFNASDYVPSDLQNDVATGRAYYDAFSQAAGAVSVSGGRVSLSPAAQEAVSGAIEATTLGAISVALPGAGAVFALALALAPKAAAGPGVCATDPPASGYLGDLQAWPHFQSWAATWGSYPPAPAGTFEAFANPVLEYNWLLGANCFGDKATPAPILLGSLISSWNAIHTAASTRTICRTVTPAAFAGQQYDPIAEALSEAAYVKYTPPLPPNPTFEQATNQTYQGPRTLSSCFAVHAGPLVVKTLTMFHVRSAMPLPVAAKMQSNATPGSGAGVVVVAAGAGLAYWLYSTGRLGRVRLPRFLRR
jgi:hypothetical protein